MQISMTTNQRRPVPNIPGTPPRVRNMINNGATQTSLSLIWFEGRGRLYTGYISLKIITPRVVSLGCLCVEESSSRKEVQFKKFCQPVKTSCAPTENVNETLIGKVHGYCRRYHCHCYRYLHLSR